MNQMTKVLNYINETGSITPFEAFVNLRITRLAAVIFNLEKAGHKFEHIMIHGVNEAGEPVRYMRYSKKSS